MNWRDVRALDCTLGDGAFRSRYDADWHNAFDVNSNFVMSYAATNVDEFFAENFRVYVV
jgi:hypothetical protein